LLDFKTAEILRFAQNDMTKGFFSNLLGRHVLTPRLRGQRYNAHLENRMTARHVPRDGSWRSYILCPPLLLAACSTRSRMY
jgi:hypothetical protein